MAQSISRQNDLVVTVREPVEIMGSPTAWVYGNPSRRFETEKVEW